MRRTVQEGALVLLDDHDEEILRMEEEISADFARVTLKGALRTEIAQEFADEMTLALLACPKISVDCAQVDSISASCMQILLNAHKLCEDAGGRLILLSPAEKMRARLEETGLHEVFGIQYA